MATTENTTPQVLDSELAAKQDIIFDRVMGDFNKARDYVKNNYQAIWDTCFKAKRLQRSHRSYNGTADEANTEIHSIRETVVTNIAGSKPKFKYLPVREDQEQNLTVLNDYAAFVWSQNKMTRKTLGVIGDFVDYGNGFLFMPWSARKGFTQIQRVALPDVFVDPTAFQLNTPDDPGYPRYMGHRFLSSLDSLKAEKIVDVETGELVAKYKNLDLVTNGAANTDEMDKARKEALIGSTLGKDALKMQTEVIDYYTQRRHIMIANRSVVILNEETPYHKNSEVVEKTTVINGQPITAKVTIPEVRGFLPYAMARNYVDDSLLYAMGDIEVILDTWEALNDTGSQKRDNLAHANNNMSRIDPRFKYMKEQIKNAPGVVIPLPKGAYEPLPKENIGPDADNEIARQTQQMRSAAAADAAAQGLTQPKGRTTATEIQAQLTQTGSRGTSKLQNIEDEFFGQVAMIIHKEARIFLDEVKAVRVMGDKGVEWATYTPGKYNDEFEPRVVLESTANAEAAMDAQEMQVMLQFFMNDPLTNQKKLRELAGERLLSRVPKDDLKELFTVDTPIVGPDGQPMDAGMQQSNALMTPGAAAMMKGEVPVDPKATGATARGKATQTGTQGGGGADSGVNNIRRTRATQPSTKMTATTKTR